MKKTKSLLYLALILTVALAACKSKKNPDSQAASETIPAELSPVLSRARAGDAEAQFEFFQKFRNIARTEEEQAEASKWCIKAAEQGNVQALGYVYSLYDDGKGVPKDHAKALEWMLKAAEVKQNSYFLPRWIAERYEYGKGTPKKIESAILWYNKALDLGDKVAAYQLGEIYWNGKGVPVNHEEAVAYFYEANALGNGGANYYLAKAATDGTGAAKDPVKAYALIRNIVGLEPEGRTLKLLLENVLTDEQEKEAERMEPGLEKAANQVHQERMKARAKN